MNRTVTKILDAAHFLKDSLDLRTIYSRNFQACLSGKHRLPFSWDVFYLDKRMIHEYVVIATKVLHVPYSRWVRSFRDTSWTCTSWRGHHPNICRNYSCLWRSYLVRTPALFPTPEQLWTKNPEICSILASLFKLNVFAFLFCWTESFTCNMQ